MPRTWASKFLLTVAIVFLVVLLSGWFTGIKQVMHTALLSVTVFAFLPVIILAAVILIPIILMLTLIVIGLLASLLSGDGGGGDIGGGEADANSATPEAQTASVVFLHEYYEWMARQRSPYFWGVPVGVLLGGAILWGLISWLIVPKEMKTSEALLRAEQSVKVQYEAQKSFPTPGANHSFPQAPDQENSPPLLDGFGRPFLYHVTKNGSQMSYRIKSLGFDGKPGKDDLCVAGSTGADWAEKLVAAVKLWNRVRPDQAIPVKDRLQLVRDLKCGTEKE
jgi:hypothetical protein